ADVGAGWPSSAAAWSAHPEYINRLRATIQVTAPNTAPAGSSIMEMDGLQFDVSWKGRPAPAYPGACDRTLPGVQWIFGGVARINWGNTSSDQFAELCASKQSAFPSWGSPNWGNGSNATRNDNGSNLGIAVFGMSEDSAGPAPVLSTDSATTFLAPDAANTTTTPPWTNSGTPVNYYKINDLAAPASAVWSNANWAAATLAFKLQNLRGYGAGQIPPGSTITDVKLVVLHREGGTLNGTWYPGGWVNKDQLTITPGTGNYGSNGYSASNWNSNAVGSPIVGTWGGFPPCYTGADNDDGDCTFTWGDPAAPAGSGTPDWSQQRDLTDSIDTPEALEGASVKWTVAVATSCAGCTHEVYVDGIVLAITYRPAGSLRPLAGCTTIRAGTYPPYLLGSSSSPLSTAQHDWLDADWGPNKSPSSAGDQAFGNFSGVNGGTGGMADAQDCPLLDVNNISASVKFHAQGMIYAPSAAVSLSGNQNDAAWFSDGIVARQLSALKWTKGNDIAVVGGEPPPRNPRLVNIEICDGSGDSSGCPAGHVTLREQFEIDDVAPGIGNVVKRLSYVQIPPS
ncbi:MAG TPA: hypothetical protein VN636_09900, partial [Acidimicrobiia bacterium]|nr:hypothetical protein [Acidimicrobiia bacterium]